MRDIRDDLRQRLQAISMQRGQIQARLAHLDQSEAHIKAVLEYERMMVEASQEDLFSDDVPSEEERSEVAKFLRDVLADGRPRNLDELKKDAAVRNLDFRGKNPGRVLHFALVGMSQNGVVESLGSGVWRMKLDDPKPSGSLTPTVATGLKAMSQIAGR